MSYGIPPRTLTHDERKAAEAAFRGLPSNPEWSQAARSVYEGLISVLRKQGEDQGEAVNLAPAGAAESAALPDERLSEAGPSPTSLTERHADASEARQADLRTLLQSREDAVQAGLLVDVTAQAETLGLSLPVGFTKALWDLAVATTQEVPEDQQAMRLRDILMALRLRLATAQPLLPLFEFPVLLAFPPDAVPQLCSLLALAHGDQSAPQALTLVLRNEVSAIITPFTN